MCAGLLTIRTERDWQLACHTSQYQVCTGRGYKYVQWLSTESLADRPWERTWSCLVEIARRAWGIVRARLQSSLSLLAWQGRVQLWWILSAPAKGDATEMLRGCWVSDGEPLGRSMQWLVSQREFTGSAHPTPQLGAASGTDRSWERSGTEAA